MNSKLVVVIGGGPAGLAVSHELKRRRIEHRVLERGSAVGQTWRDLYDSLTLHTGKHLSSLPGQAFSRSTPIFPRRDDFVAYLERYAEKLPVEGHCTVNRLVRLNQTWRVLTSRGELRAHAVVVCTGIVANPRKPALPGADLFRGTIRHSVEYRRPEPFAGKRVLVVGGGNSAAEIASELARAGVDVTVSIRSGVNVVPKSLLGIPIQYLALFVRRFPSPLRDQIVAGVGAISKLRHGPSPFPPAAHGPLEAIPMIGMDLVRAIRDGVVGLRGEITSLTAEGALFADGSEKPFDEILLATGYRAALAPLADLVKTDGKGFAQRHDRVVSQDQPNLYFVGHNYDSAGGLYNIRMDAPKVAQRLA